ncbi:unnamed protein product [Calypogeia fissa]
MATRNSIMKAVGPVIHLILATVASFTALCIFQPFLPILLLDILCPGENSCGAVIYLIGALQLGMGIGAVVISPILGGLSDAYGRKPILLLIFIIGVLPQVLLLCIRTKTAVYIWFVITLVSFIVREGGLLPTLLASVADVVDESRRPEANGSTVASLTVGFIVGTFASTAFKTVDQALWASVILQIVATIYLQICCKETNPRGPVLPANESQSESAMKLLPKPEVKRQLFLDFRETTRTVWSSRRLMIIALLNFLNTYGLAGLESFTVYYLIGVFNYGEKQLATLYIVGGVAGSLAMVIVYPALSHMFGERIVLWIGLLGGAAHYCLYGLAWTSWVPYFASGMDLFHSMVKPALGTMVSSGLHSDQQGKMQGLMGAIRSVSIILAPLTITPLSAISLGDNPPFGMKGFPFIVIASAMLLAWVLSAAMPPLPPPMDLPEPTEYIQAPMPPVENSIVPA